MAMRILDIYVVDRLITERQAAGIPPIANNEHQQLAGSLAAIVDECLNCEDAWILAGANVSDRESDWTFNYRCPDVLVVLPAPGRGIWIRTGLADQI